MSVFRKAVWIEFLPVSVRREIVCVEEGRLYRVKDESAHAEPADNEAVGGALGRGEPLSSHGRMSVRGQKMFRNH